MKIKLVLLVVLLLFFVFTPVFAATTKAQDIKMQETNIVKAGQNFFTVKGGLAGGAILIGTSIAKPVKSFYLGGEAGYCIGNQFGVLNIGIFGLYPFSMDTYSGIELNYANYSTLVQSVPLLSGNISGGNIGIGIFIGKTFGDIQAQFGYNTVLGLRGDLGYKRYL